MKILGYCYILVNIGIHFFFFFRGLWIQSYYFFHDFTWIFSHPTPFPPTPNTRKMSVSPLCASIMFSRTTSTAAAALCLQICLFSVLKPTGGHLPPRDFRHFSTHVRQQRARCYCNNSRVPCRSCAWHRVIGKNVTKQMVSRCALFKCYVMAYRIKQKRHDPRPIGQRTPFIFFAVVVCLFFFFSSLSPVPNILLFNIIYI